MNRLEEVLTILQEECAEVIVEASKIKRFGINSVYEDSTAREKLKKELGDLLCMMDILSEMDVFTYPELHELAEKKREKLKTWSSVYNEEWEENNERMDIIGQNGNDGLHYESST